MSTPRRRVLRQPRAAEQDARRRQQMERRRAQLEKEQTSLARWMSRVEAGLPCTGKAAAQGGAAGEGAREAGARIEPHGRQCSSFPWRRPRRHFFQSTILGVSPMTLAEQLSEYIRACFPGIWIQSHEHEDALGEIAQLCRAEEWRLAVWDIARGVSFPGAAADDAEASAGADPLAAIRSAGALAGPDGAGLLVLVNFHRFLSSPEVIQTVAQQISHGKQNRTFLIVLSPVVSLPPELEKLFTVIEHSLPIREAACTGPTRPGEHVQVIEFPAEARDAGITGVDLTGHTSLTNQLERLQDA
jgi:hypothetical protein